MYRNGMLGALAWMRTGPTSETTRREEVGNPFRKGWKARTASFQVKPGH